MYIPSWYTRQWIVLLCEKENILKILSVEKGEGWFQMCLQFSCHFSQCHNTVSLFKCLSGIWLHLQNMCCTYLAQLWSDFKILIYWDQVVVPNCSQSIFCEFNLEMPQGFILLLYYFWSITVFASGWLSFVDMTFVLYGSADVMQLHLGSCIVKKKW